MLIPTDAFSALEKASFVAGGADAILALLTDTAMRERPVAADDGALGQTVTTDTAGPFPCFVAPARTWVERVEGGALRAISYWRISFENGADIQPTDRISVNGSIFEVTETDESSSNAVLLQAQCVRIR